MKDGEYSYAKHGLLFIVYQWVDTGITIASAEDSRWDSEEQAKEHCRILNADQ